jgi:hypothetical protein
MDSERFDALENVSTPQELQNQAGISMKSESPPALAYL